MKAYKAGLPVPEISDEEAKLLYEANKDSTHAVTPPPIDTTAAAAEDVTDSSDDTTSSDDESPAPVVKEPSPVPAKKQRVGKDASKKKLLAAEPEPVLDPLLRATEKKKPGKKAKAPAAEAIKPEASVVSPPKTGEKQKKKKRKSAAAE